MQSDRWLAGLMRQSIVLTAFLGASAQPVMGQAAAYPAAEVIGEFRDVCTDVTNVSALRQRAAKRGWVAASPPENIVDGKNPVPGSAGEFKLDTDDQQIFYLGRTVASRKLWLMVMDMRFPASKGATVWQACAVLDEGAPKLASSDVAKLVGREPTVKQTPFNSTQFRWNPALSSGAEYTTIDYCADHCLVISGLVFESGIPDVTAASTATKGK